MLNRTNDRRELDQLIQTLKSERLHIDNKISKLRKLRNIETLISSEDLRKLANGKKSKKKSKKTNVETPEGA